MVLMCWLMLQNAWRLTTDSSWLFSYRAIAGCDIWYDVPQIVFGVSKCVFAAFISGLTLHATYFALQHGLSKPAYPVPTKMVCLFIPSMIKDR